MIQQIINQISPSLISGLTEKVGLNRDESEKAVGVTKDSLSGILGKEVASGNPDGVLQLLNQGESAGQSPMFQKVLNKLTGDYVSKLGLSPDMANSVGAFLLPKILGAVSGSKGGNLSISDLSSLAGEAMSGSIGNKADSFIKGGVGNLFKK